MPIQTQYGFFHEKGLVGMPYDLTNKEDVTADATTPIEFGVGLVFDSARTPANNRIAVKLPDAADNVFAGIAVYDRTNQENTGVEAGLGDLTTTEGTRYRSGDAIRMRRKGRLNVYSEQPINSADPVFLRFAAGAAGTAIGYFRKDADAGKAFQVPARWVGSTTAPGLAVLEINLPSF